MIRRDLVPAVLSVLFAVQLSAQCVTSDTTIPPLPGSSELLAVGSGWPATRIPPPFSRLPRRCGAARVATREGPPSQSSSSGMLRSMARSSQSKSLQVRQPRLDRKRRRSGARGPDLGRLLRDEGLTAEA